MKAFRAMIAFLAAVLIVIAANAQEEKESEKKEEEEKEVIVNYEIIQQGTYSGKKDATATVITTQAQWEALWKEHVSVLVPQPPLPPIDFESYVVVVIFAGEKKSGGYAAVIKDIKAELNDAIVRYKLTEPQADSFNIQVITQPFVMLKVEKPQGTVKLIKE